MINPEQLSFIDKIAPGVIEAVRRYPGTYASVGIAQAILETGWGKSPLAVEANNFFGVKWHGDPAGPFPGHVTGVYLHRTTERPDSGEYVIDAYFRTYDDVLGSCLDWADNLKAKKVYADAGAWTAADADEFIRRIGPVYTGGDSTYSTKILRLMDDYNLRRFDKKEPNTMRIIPRSEWGARPARSSNKVARSRRTAFVVHYDDGRPTTRTGVAIPKGIQNFHMDSNGWRDGGYNFVISQAGAIYEMRGWDELGAHAGSKGNVEGIGVQVHIGGDQRPSQEALAALVWLKAEADRLFGRSLAWKGHRDYMSTSCPGAPLYDWIKAGGPLAGVIPSPATPTTARYVRPVDAKHRVTAEYRKPGNWQRGYHTGIDFGAPEGAPVYAVAEGDVRDRGNTYGPDYGIVVTINEDDDSGGAGAGSDWTYCHLSRRVVSTGQRVKAGQLIGYVGNTGRSSGPHLHLERRPRMGGYGTDLDPVLWNDTPAPATPTPATAKDDTMPEIRETHTVRFNHPGESRFATDLDRPVIGADVIGPLLYNIVAVVTGPEGANVSARLAYLDRKGGKWVGRSVEVPGAGNVVVLPNIGHTAHPECSIFVDVKSDVPGEVRVEQTAHFWRR